MKRLIPLVLLSGCSIASRSDKFGADLEIGVGGIVSYVADLKLKASVGFSKTCNCKEENHGESGDLESDPAGLLHFL